MGNVMLGRPTIRLKKGGNYTLEIREKEAHCFSINQSGNMAQKNTN